MKLKRIKQTVKTLHLKPSGITNRVDICYISDVIYTALHEMGIHPESYSWELLIDIKEYEDSSNG